MELVCRESVREENSQKDFALASIHPIYLHLGQILLAGQAHITTDQSDSIESGSLKI